MNIISGLSCDDSEFACLDHSECIAAERRCDRSEECADGSDEWDCRKRNMLKVYLTD